MSLEIRAMVGHRCKMSAQFEHFVVPVAAVKRRPQGANGNETAYEVHRRFDRMARLVGEPALERLFRSHVMVIGLGGVGSFAAESLVRSGVGRVSLVDFRQSMRDELQSSIASSQGQHWSHQGRIIGRAPASCQPASAS